jgi:hypothetical protein
MAHSDGGDERGTRPVRIGNCSGFYGDRLSALEEIVTGGPVDVVTGDYLAEVTMLVLARSRRRDPAAGYATTFLRQFEPVAGLIAERGTKVVVNAGGLNPAGLADALAALLGRVGVDLAVARVEGDDLSSRLDALAAGGGLTHLDTGAPFASWGREPLTANAYLGGFGIAAALRAGADVVVTGRVADASLVTGAAAWWFGWTPDDLDALAGGVVAGHVIECGAQATGGNFSGFAAVADLRHPGFPIAEVDADGSSVITKHPGTGGAVTVDTVTAQLLYEIGAPGYLNPDVVALLDTVQLAGDGPDRVRIGPVQGTPPPATTKVAITALGGWRNASTLVLTGLDVDAKAAVAEAAVRAALDGVAGIDDLRFTRIGVPAEDPTTQMQGSCLLHIAVDGDEAACGRAFSSVVIELALANYPGLYATAPPGNGGPYGAYWPTLVRQDAVAHRVVHADGTVEAIPPPARVRTGGGSRPYTGERHPTFVEEPAAVEAALGRVAHARSGDKGGNANVGVWVGDDERWPWLAATLTTERFQALLPETAGLRVDRHELANLRAVNFVVHGLLDGGATEARRFDTQAKALGEWLRARHLRIPTRFLDRP